MSSYLRNIKDAFGTMTAGLKLTFRYLFEARKSRTPIGIEDDTYFETDKGIVTLQYPHESFPVPDNGRYRLHNEIEDCIVCDKCAKICPVDCIEIDAIRAPETYGMTSDGTPKRIHAAKFDIDMSKCCFCGLCTTVCPTECLTMTKVYDFSEFEVEDHIYSFADMSLADIAQKRKELEAYEAEKAKAKEAATADATSKPKVSKPSVKPKPIGAKAAKPMVPGAKPKISPGSEKQEVGDSSSKPKKPVMKPKISGASSEKAKPARPVMKPKTSDESGSEKAKAKPVVKPKVKPVIKTTKSEDVPEADQPKKPKAVKPVMKKSGAPKPVIKPRAESQSPNDEATEKEEEKPKPKYRPRPVIKRKPKDEE